MTTDIPASRLGTDHLGKVGAAMTEPTIIPEAAIYPPGLDLEACTGIDLIGWRIRIDWCGPLDWCGPRGNGRRPAGGYAASNLNWGILSRFGTWNNGHIEYHLLRQYRFATYEDAVNAAVKALPALTNCGLTVAEWQARRQP